MSVPERGLRVITPLQRDTNQETERPNGAQPTKATVFRARSGRFKLCLLFETSRLHLVCARRAHRRPPTAPPLPERLESRVVRCRAARKKQEVLFGYEIRIDGMEAKKKFLEVSIRIRDLFIYRGETHQDGSFGSDVLFFL